MTQDKQNIAMVVSYIGNNYHGWQEQKKYPQLATVETKVKQAIATIANQNIDEIKINVAGRTDKGVNATGQVINFTTHKVRTESVWITGLNQFLPNDIRVLACKKMPLDFHSRFSAKKRRYQYIIYNANHYPAIYQKSFHWQRTPLDVNLMHEALQAIIGVHDFVAFTSSIASKKPTVREVYQAKVIRNNHFVVIDICASSFVHNMVRSLAYLLIQIGLKRLSENYIQQLIDEKDRSKRLSLAYAYGLYLIEVSYEEVDFSEINYPISPFELLPY